jgi:FAD/FMN-containing dehydrogenase
MVENTQSLMVQNGHSKEDVKVVGYGHLGDGNLHLNIVSRKGKNNHVLNLLEPWLFQQLYAVRGSVSAEHGLGQAKNEFIYFSKSPECVKLMQQLKQLMDPKGILNPYKVLPSEQAVMPSLDQNNNQQN